MATNFKQKEPSEILKTEYLDRHTEEMQYFHNRLTFLHHNVYFLQQIADFPLGIFISPVDDHFLRFVANNFMQVAILQITKLTTDNGRDARTLNRFRTFMNSAVKDEYANDYRVVLKNARFTSRTRETIKKAKHLRDTQIAHSVESSEPFDSLTFGEITDIAGELTKLFEVASFGTEYRYLTFAYDPDVRRANGGDQRPDIERILDGIARDSPTLNEPETNPVAWAHLRLAMPPQALEVLNRYRRKLGMPEA